MRPGKSIMKATKNLMSRVKGERPCWTRRCEDANGCQIAALKNDMILLYTNNHSVSEVGKEEVLCVSMNCIVYNNVSIFLSSGWHANNWYLKEFFKHVIQTRENCPIFSSWLAYKSDWLRSGLMRQGPEVVAVVKLWSKFTICHAGKKWNSFDR